MAKKRRNVRRELVVFGSSNSQAALKKAQAWEKRWKKGSD
jgi:hypothetical protein